MLKSKTFINVLWRDQFDMTARNYARSANLKSLISEYMIDTRQFSDSLILELEDQELNVEKMLAVRNKKLELLQQAQTIVKRKSIRKSHRLTTRSSDM
jgi:predicted RNA methylase